ncbi:MAG TPA: efflux RND transporter periplasmic adaptor subunit [Gemmataceae bacterium]|jgi:cobalt-zinc-cadmium efflux system membrane fusion protein
MLRTLAALARRGFALLANVFVLLVLIGLLWWGRQYKWKVPSFAALTGGAGAEAGAKVEDAGGGLGTQVTLLSPGDPALKEEEPPLYKVQLRSPETIHKAGIETAPVVERALAQEVAAYGAIDFDQTHYAELSPRASGTVWRVLKKAGEVVHKGEVLGLVAAPAVATGKARFLQWSLQVEVRTNVLKRLKSVEKGVVSERQLREAEAALAEAQLSLFESQQTLINLGLPLDVEEMRTLSEQKRSYRLRVLGVPESILKETDPARLPTNLLPLIAPFDGEVVQLDMVPGEVVTSSQVQMIVADTRRMWIRLDARQEDAPEIKIGQEVRFEPDNPGLKPVSGNVTWIRRDVDVKTRTVHVRAEVSNPEGLLRPNTFGTGHILVRSSAHGVAVPTRAIQREGKVYFVFVGVGDSVFEQRRIVPGIRADDFTEVRSGVQPGEVVVTAGSHLLKSAIVRNRLLTGEN